MSEASHDLAHEFPEYKDKIHELKTSNGRFTHLARDYHDVAKELHRIEVGIDTPSDAYVEGLKRKRLKLKDELYAMLKVN